MLFCAFVGSAWAQTLPADDKSFTLTTDNRGGLAANDGKTACVGFNHTAVANEAQKNFAFIQHEGNVYLYNVWAEKFMMKDGSLNTTLPIDAIQITNLGNGKYFFKFDEEHVVNLGGSSQLTIDSWGSSTWGSVDEGNSFTLTEVEDFDPTAALAILKNSYTITYKFVYNETEVGSQTTKVAAGANYPSIDSNLLPWGATASVPTGAPAEDETVTLNCTVDASVLPFVAAESYDDANMKWYYLMFDSSNKFYLHHDGGQNYIDLDSKAVDKSNKDAYSWAFIGNPFDGYKIVNRATGEGYILSSSTTMQGSTGADTWPIMTEEQTLPVGNNTYWIPTESSHATNGFYLAQKDFPANRMNNRSKLAYWTGGAGSGSTFMVVERPMGPVAELEALVEEAEAFSSTVNANVGAKIGEYTQATADALAAAIATANAVVEAETATAEDVATLQAAMDAVKYILPTVGQYYQIHSALSAFSQEKAVFSTGTGAEWKTLNDADKSFFWKAVDAGNGNVVFQNAADGKYLVGNAAQSGAWTVADAPSAASYVGVKIFSKEENEKGYEYGIVLNNWQMHCNGHVNGTGNASNIVSWNTDTKNSASSWYLVPKTLPTFYTVTYNFVYNEEVKYSQTTQIAAGGAYPEINVPVIPYGVTASNVAKPEGIVEADHVENFVLTVTKELPFKAAADVNNITAWYYAQMHANPSVTSYLEDTNEGTDVEWKDKAVAESEIDSHLWGFVGDIWNGIKVVNKATGRAIVSTSGAAVLGEKANATAFIPVLSNGNIESDWFCLKYPTSNYLNASGEKIGSWGDADNGSSWFLTEYKETEVAVSALGYATLFLGQATYIPEGVEVYTVTEAENGWATLTQVEGVLPANTGVILKNEGEFTFKTAGATGSAEGNMLEGSVEDAYIEGEAYVLANGEKGVGLYKAALNKDAEGNDGDTHFLNNAGKAYLKLPVASSVKAFFFDRNTTAIESVVNGLDANAPIYDLSGRRVNAATKGIYIQNGKKFIVK